MISAGCAARAARVRPLDALNGSFLPFLYQTRTIQYQSQREGGNRRRRRPSHTTEESNFASRPDRRDDGVDRRPKGRTHRKESSEGYLPWQGTTPNADVLNSMSGSTMTPRETQIFEELLRKGAQTKKAEDESKSNERDRNSRTGYKPESKRYGASAQERRAVEFPGPIRQLAEESAKLREKASAADATTEEYMTSVKALLNFAETDIEAWKVLDERVFRKLRDLGLDSEEHARDVSSRQHELNTMTDALPELLLHFVKMINTSWPASVYGLHVLPTLRKIGLSAFVLGATTDLFNEHMRILYRRYTDIDGVVQTLSEMDKEVYEYNAGSKELIRSIFQHTSAAIKGQLGPGLQAFWSTDRKTRALEKLRRWEDQVEERIRAAAVRRAMDKAADGLVEEEEDDDAVAAK